MPRRGLEPPASALGRQRSVPAELPGRSTHGRIRTATAARPLASEASPSTSSSTRAEQRGRRDSNPRSPERQSGALGHSATPPGRHPAGEGVGFEPTKTHRAARTEQADPSQKVRKQRKRRDSNSQRARGAPPVFGTGSSSSRIAPTVRREGLEPPEPNGARSTAGPAPRYGLPPRRASSGGGGIRTREGLRRRFCGPAPSAAREPLRPSSTSTPGGIRTPDIRIWSHGALPLSYRRISSARSISTPGGTRTPDVRFWRPALYPLSYRRIHRNPSKRPEGFEPPPSGFVIRRSAPAELRARSSCTIHQAPGGIRTLGLRTGGPALRPAELQAHLLVLIDVAQPREPAEGEEYARHRESRSPGRRILPRRVPTRTALLFHPNPSCQNERAPCLPGPSSGRQGACVPAPGAGRAIRALRRTTSHGDPVIPTVEP
jgi:hypothetical protein